MNTTDLDALLEVLQRRGVSKYAAKSGGIVEIEMGPVHLPPETPPKLTDKEVKELEERLLYAASEG